MSLRPKRKKKKKKRKKKEEEGKATASAAEAVGWIAKCFGTDQNKHKTHTPTNSERHATEIQCAI